MISVLERAKTVRALGRSTTAIGLCVNEGEVQNSAEHSDSSMLPLRIEQVMCGFLRRVYCSARQFQHPANR
jgi:hypothetical protein